MPCPPLSITLTGPTTTINPGDSAVITWQVTGGSLSAPVIITADTGFMTPQWVTFGALPQQWLTVTPPITTTYTATITDECGQVASASFTVNVAYQVGGFTVTPNIQTATDTTFNGGALFPLGIYSIVYDTGAWFPTPATAIKDGAETIGAWFGGTTIAINNCAWTAGDIVLVITPVLSATVTGITGGGLSFSRIASTSQTTTAGACDLEVWGAIAAGTASSQTLTVQYNATPQPYPNSRAPAASMIAVSNTTLPVDNSVTVTSAQTSGSFSSAAITPTQTWTQELIITWVATVGSSPTGFTQVVNFGASNSGFAAFLQTNPNITGNTDPAQVVGTASGAATPNMAISLTLTLPKTWFVGIPLPQGYVARDVDITVYPQQTTTGFSSFNAAVAANVGFFGLFSVDANAGPSAIRMALINADPTRVDGPVDPTYLLYPTISVWIWVPIQTIIAGNSAILHYRTNAQVTTIDNGVGTVTPTVGSVTVSPTTTTTYTITGATTGFTTATMSAKVIVIPLTPPRLSATSVCSGGVLLAWGNATSQPTTSYTVSRSPDGITYSVVASGITTTFYTDTPPSPLTNYFYVVQAVNNGAISADSNAVVGYGLTAPASAPGSPAVQAFAGALAVSAATVPFATSYNLYRSLTSGGEGATPLITGLTSPYYYDTGIRGATVPYFYQFTAVNVCGEGAKSSEVSGTPLPFLPGDINQPGGPPATTITASEPPTTTMVQGGPPVTKYY